MSSRGGSDRGGFDGGRGRGGFDGGRGRGGFDGGRGGRGGGRGGRGGFEAPSVYSPKGPLAPPSAQVEKTENAVAAALTKKQQKSADWPERPGFGTQGRPVTLFANYFELKSASTQLYRYNVDIHADSAGKKPTGKKARQVVRLLLEEHLLSLKDSIVTDYMSTLISSVKLPEDERDYDVRYRNEDEDEYPENPTVYRVKYQFTGTLNSGDLLNYLTSSNAAAMFASKADVLQAMNIILGFQPKSDMTIASVGANKHFAMCGGAEEKYNLGNGLEALRGFFVSVRAATARLLVNVQVKYAACYQEGPLGNVIAAYDARDVHQLRKFLRNLRVSVTHIQKKNKKGQVIPRIKRISGLATPRDGASLQNPPRVARHGAGPRDVQFFLDAPGQQPSSAQQSKRSGKKPAKAGPAPAGKYISVADFFRQNYNLNVDASLPVVNVGTSENPSYLPVEVCVVQPGQQANTKLTPNQTRNMLNFAVRSPTHNAESIVNQGTNVLSLGAPANPTLVKFGIQTDPRLVTVPGRVLAPPNVLYKDVGKPNQKSIKPLGGSWNMKSIRFSTSSNLSSWAWILLDFERGRRAFNSPDELSNCLRNFTAKLNEIGVVAQMPKGGERVVLDRSQSPETQIEKAVAKLMAVHKPSLILTILPAIDTELYNSIKRVCDLQHGVRNVNVLGEKFAKSQDQYFANVGLKFNLKLGGINQILDPKELPLIGQNKTMLVGIDVTHPSPGSSSAAPSVAGMVASVDSSLGQWPAELRIQTARQEMVNDLDTMLKAHLNRWARAHKSAYPENIIVYRDGVSEGQYDLVVQQELTLLKEACKETYPAPDTAKGLPRISIVVVGKRHHTRFYPSKLEDADRSGNPHNGTVVDRGVTEARNWEFYLQAHTALKGTARPAHYFTVWDEIFCREKAKFPHQNAADILEGLTYHVCFLFGRATKAVSICPPAYYADLVCTRARCYLSHVFDQETPTGSVVTGHEPSLGNTDVKIHPNVRDTMFYI
ncbi:Piwi-domain-containing protein [Aspergillus heteromorphus CBS 117.55]|uniref:Piwi-domain-containing protein n=1 Tax=Aspergillus heteromorphus CBS 117.55 TaxID=1448321 RepID=A0A317WS49_9EURO|nr:Piwi-domain-containing protein [Aspergillus heteromorphus CBS 117.55]PWY89283.1 Piwi-domain-containing protein [Aspergillus heteromorphus CBS 117.55]